MKQKYYCTVSGEVIPDERVEALRILEVPESEWTLKEHSGVRRKQAIWMGDVGRSELRIVKKLGASSVREVFQAERTVDDGDDLESSDE